MVSESARLVPGEKKNQRLETKLIGNSVHFVIFLVLFLI